MTKTRNSALTPTFIDIDGLRIRYADNHQPRGISVVLCSPWPESLYAYGPIWESLGDGFHLIALDLPGFGGSQGRTELMCPSAMGDFIVQFADEMDLGMPHIVAPDVGESACLFATAKHPNRFGRIVVGSGATAYPLKVTGALKEIIQMPDLDELAKSDPQRFVKGCLENMARYRLPPLVLQDYLDSYAGARLVQSAEYVRHYPRDLAVLATKLSDIQTPVQIVSGRLDPFVPPVDAQWLHDRLPNSEVEFLDCGHFIWEDEASAFVRICREWFTRDFLLDPISRACNRLELLR